MKAIVRLDVPDYQIGQEVHVYFKDSMTDKGICEQEKVGHWIDDEFGSKCSCCGIHTHLDKFDRPMKFKHCSMCGARMESKT